MSKNVKLNFKVTGDFSDLEVFAAGERLPSTNGKGSLNDFFVGEVLKVEFQISGDNGTDYSITYTCKSDGKSVEDPEKPSPVEGTIQRGGFKNEIIKINI